MENGVIHFPVRTRQAVWGLLVFCLVWLCGLAGLNDALAVEPAPPSAAAAQLTQQELGALTLMEQALLSAKYERETPEARITRLEETIFGEPRTGQPLSARIAELHKVLAERGAHARAAESAQSGQPAPEANGPNLPSLNPTPYAPSQSASKPVINKNSAKSNTTKANAAKSGKGSKTVTAPKLEKLPVPQTQPAPAAAAAQPPVAAPPVSQDGTDYPTVGQMEQKVFGQSFPKEDITNRLARLEQRVFGHVQNGALIDRVDALKLSVLGDIGTTAATPPGGYYPVPPQGGYPAPYPQGGTPYGAPTYQGDMTYGRPGGVYSPYPASPAPSPYGTPPGYTDPSMPSNQGDPVGHDAMASDPGVYGAGAAGAPSSPDMLAAITQVEKQVLKKTYPMEPASARLSRLETKIFHSPAPPGMSEEDRLQRIIAVASAGGDNVGNTSTAGSSIRGILPILLMLVPLLL
jgi:hypothetical protein